MMRIVFKRADGNLDFRRRRIRESGRRRRQLLTSARAHSALTAAYDVNALRWSDLVSAFHLLNHILGLPSPLLAIAAEPYAFRRQLPVCADYPIARDAVNAQAFGVRLREESQ